MASRAVGRNRAEALAILEGVADAASRSTSSASRARSLRGPAGTGRFQMFPGTGHSLMHWVGRIAARARHVVAVGTCAAYGGVTAAGGNPTDAVGLQYDGAHPGGLLLPDWRSLSGQPVLNVAGCPTHPGWVTETLLMLAAGEAPPRWTDWAARGFMPITWCITAVPRTNLPTNTRPRPATFPKSAA
ncbi:MAG: hypothetical protein R3D63_13180 [Paracoccaceae bacterium]